MLLYSISLAPFISYKKLYYATKGNYIKELRTSFNYKLNLCVLLSIYNY